MGPHPCLEQGAQQRPQGTEEGREGNTFGGLAGPTLAEVCESYCSASKNKTISEYRRILWGEALPRLGGDLPVSRFGWDHKQQGGGSGREVVMAYVDASHQESTSAGRQGADGVEGCL